MNDSSSSPGADLPPNSRPRSSRRRAIIVSLIVHALIAAVLLFTYLPNREPSDASSGVASLAAGPGEPLPGSQTPPPASLAANEVTEVPREQIEKSIESQIEQVSRLSDEEKLDQLEKNLKRLESISDAESVQDVTDTIASTLGLDATQYDPDKPAAEGAFDYDTAQLHDVSREKTESGKWQYQSILVDSDGRKLTVPMSAAEGETLYSTFEQMKKYPLAEVIYRGVVMPLIQKMIEAEKPKADVAATDESESEEEVNDTLGGSGVGFGGIGNF